MTTTPHEPKDRKPASAAERRIALRRKALAVIDALQLKREEAS